MSSNTKRRRAPPNVFFLDDDTERELCSTCTLPQCVEDTRARGEARLNCNIVREGLRQREEREAKRGKARPIHVVRKFS